MAYISSNANRWYCARESAYGQVPAINAVNRIPAVKLTAQQQREKSQRKDKTGSRTWQGMPAGMRQQTTFDLTSYMRDWPDPTTLPSHGPLFEAAMGAAGVLWAGGTAGPGNHCVEHCVRLAARFESGAGDYMRAARSGLWRRSWTLTP